MRHLRLYSQATLQRRYVWFIPILLLAFALRMWDINARAVWFDEAVEYWAASAPLSALPETVLTAYQPPLFTYLLHIWLQLSMDPVWLRFLSVVLSTLTTVGIMAWAYRLFGLRGALIAGGITALSPADIRYAQETGEYALMGFAMTWSLVFLDYALRRPNWKLWGLWGFMSVASLYSHYGTGIVVVSLALLTLFENAWRSKWQVVSKQVAVAAGSLMLGLPLLAYFLPKQIQPPSYDAHTTATLSTLTGIERFVTSIGDTFVFQLTGGPYSPIPQWIGGAVVAVIILLSLVILFNPLSKMSKRPLWWLLIVYISYSLAVTSGWYAYGTYGFRYALIMAPLFTLAAAAVIEQLVRWKQPIAALALLAVIAVLGVYSLPNRTLSQLTRGALAWPETEDMGGITQYWIAHRSNDEPTYVYYGAVPAFRYYLRLYGVDKDPLPPAWYTACWEQEKKEVCARDGVFYGEWLRTRSAEEKVLSIQETLGQYPPRLWLVFSHTYPGEDQLILQGLLKQYHVAASNEQVGASAYLLERFETGGASP